MSIAITVSVAVLDLTLFCRGKYERDLCRIPAEPRPYGPLCPVLLLLRRVPVTGRLVPPPAPLTMLGAQVKMEYTPVEFNMTCGK